MFRQLTALSGPSSDGAGLEAAEHRDSVHDAPTIFERTTKLHRPRVCLGERSASEVEFRRAAGPGDRGTGGWQAKAVKNLPDHRRSVTNASTLICPPQRTH